MKKILTATAALALVASCAAVSASAALEDWVPGNGYLIEDIAGEVLVQEMADGINVRHGGYYVNGVDWGGVAYNVPIALDGAKVEIRIDTLPDYEGDEDAWISVCFLDQPQLFQVGDYASNPGISNLLRYTYAEARFEEYGPDAFSCVNTTTDTGLNVAEGDILTVELNSTGTNTYVMTVNGIEMPTEYDLTGLMDDGMGYLVISASFINSNPDAYGYTILSVNGEPTVAPEPEVVEPAEGEVADTEAPTTSDAGIVAAAALMAVAAGVVLSKKH